MTGTHTELDTDGDPDPECCALCGADDIQVTAAFAEDDTRVLRGLCAYHAAKLERWWKREQQAMRQRSRDHDHHE